MRKLFVAVVIISWSLTLNVNAVLADWWQRSDVRPTQPSQVRYIPTDVPTQQPTTPPSVPSATPRVGEPSSPSPTQQPTGGTSGSTSSSDDPCAPGKSYYGPSCGWSPRVGGESSGGGGGSVVSEPKKTGKVLGLSNTSSSDLNPSDIILLTGILCLALYARSKLLVGKLH